MFKIKREMEQTLSEKFMRSPITCYDFNHSYIIILSEQKYIDGKLMYLCHEKSEWGWTNKFWIEKQYFTIKYRKTYETINNIKK